MSHLLGIFGELPLDTAAVMRHAGLEVADPDAPTGHGTAVGHGHQVLLKRRPQSVGPVSVPALCEGIRTTSLVMHVRLEGKAKTQDTQPFRFGPWMWAAVGELQAERSTLQELKSALPDSLQRNVEGSSAEEMLFHLWLSHLRDGGTSPKQWQVEPQYVVGALRSALSHWKHATGHTPRIGALLASSQYYYVASLGRPMRALPLMMDPLSTVAIEGGQPTEPPEAWVFAEGPAAEGWIPVEAGEVAWHTYDLRHGSTPIPA